MANAFEQVFGYNPLDEWNNLSDWQKKGSRGANLSPLVDAQIGYMGQQETNKANAQLAQQQNDFNLMMWNKQNEYNSPAATMQRLVEAGINPRAYQQIGQFANASQPHKAERPEYDSPLGKLAKFSEQAQIELAYKKLNLDKLRLTTDTINAAADKINAHRSLNEVKRHNLAQEAATIDYNSEVWRHNTAIEADAKNRTAIESAKFRSTLEQMGITIKERDGYFVFDVPQWLKTANQNEKLEYVNELQQRVKNLKQDYEYKEGLNAWYEANQILGFISRILGVVIKP